MRWALSIQVAVMDQVAVGDGVTSSEETPPSCTLCVYVLHTHMTQQQKKESEESCRWTRNEANHVCHVTQRAMCAAPRSDLSGGCPGRQIRGSWAGCRDVRSRTRT